MDYHTIDSRKIPGILVTNSHMPGALGDSIAGIPALKKFLKSSKDFVECVVWSCGAMKDLYNLDLPQYTLEEVEQHNIASVSKLDTQEVVRKNSNPAASLPEMYAEFLQVPFTNAEAWPYIQPTDLTFLEKRIDVSKPFALLAPFSHSDGGSNTKAWAIWKWHKLASTFKERGIEPIVLGVRGNNFDTWKENGVVCMISQPIQEVASSMRAASATISVDNGMGWLAKAVSAPHIQILSTNMHENFAWDFGKKAINITNCKSASIQKVWDSYKELVGI